MDTSGNIVPLQQIYNNTEEKGEPQGTATHTADNKDVVRITSSNTPTTTGHQNKSIFQNALLSLTLQLANYIRQLTLEKLFNVIDS